MRSVKIWNASRAAISRAKAVRPANSVIKGRGKRDRARCPSRSARARPCDKAPACLARITAAVVAHFCVQPSHVRRSACNSVLLLGC